jgi:hypothetical protein
MKGHIVVLLLIIALTVNAYTTGYSGAVLLSDEDVACLIDTKITTFMQWAFSDKEVARYARHNVLKLIGAFSSVGLLIDTNYYIPPTYLAKRVCEEVVSGTGHTFPAVIYITPGTNKWYSNPIANQEYLGQLVDALEYYKRCFNGVVFVSNASFWNYLFGAKFERYSSYPLLWYDNSKSSCTLSGWISFGGWTSPPGLMYKDEVMCKMFLSPSCYWTKMPLSESLNHTVATSST